MAGKVHSYLKEVADTASTIYGPWFDTLSGLNRRVAANANPRASNMSDLVEIYSIMWPYQNRNFVQRILKPDAYPKLWDNERGIFGEPSTHSMAAEVDRYGNAYVFPTVIMQGDSLKRLGLKEAFNYAQATNELIPFGRDLDKAIWFSQNYKKVWNR